MKTPKEYWDDTSSNAEQQYLTHGIFRYFGKLPPTLTGRILDEVGVGPGKKVIDVMCGSGTTVIEAVVRGAQATGIDCNDASVLISKVKTTALSVDSWLPVLNKFRQDFGDAISVIDVGNGRKGNLCLFSSMPRSFIAKPRTTETPKIQNLDHWFDPVIVKDLQAIRAWVNDLRPGPVRDLATVAFLSSIRACSRASVRIGRLFRDNDKAAPNAFAEMEKRFQRCGEAVSSLTLRNWDNASVSIELGDAKAISLKSVFDVVFCHPPYFGLYKYSSDVLRLELGWMGADRKAISRREVCDGFKTTDETLVKQYVADMRVVAAEALKLTAHGGYYIVVTADSTLRKERLPILDPLVSDAEKLGWSLERRIIRRVRYAQASYHKSADADIRRPNDEILIFRKN